ncbi:hypothetical protein NL425_26575, partial [Klebsiella pneumoniae]|nr:hypothetical protein [Klebsiella pneumoniae]
VQSIIERLGEANSTFQSAMSSAVGNLGHFSSTFSKQVEAFNTTVTGIGLTAETTASRFDGQVRSLKDLSQGALSEIAGLTDRFEQQSR